MSCQACGQSRCGVCAGVTQRTSVFRKLAVYPKQVLSKIQDTLKATLSPLHCLKICATSSWTFCILKGHQLGANPAVASHFAVAPRQRAEAPTAQSPRQAEAGRIDDPTNGVPWGSTLMQHKKVQSEFGKGVTLGEFHSWFIAPLQARPPTLLPR